MATNHYLGTRNGAFLVILSDGYVIGRWDTQEQADAHRASSLALDPTAQVDVYTAEEWYTAVPL